MSEHVHAPGRADPPGPTRTLRVPRVAHATRSLKDGHELLAVAGRRDLRGQLDGARSGGAPLPQPRRAELEHKFGVDLGAVRLHRGERVDALAEGLGATALTSGDHVFLHRSAPHPSASAGGHLLAHEVTHVLQQRRGSVDGSPGPSGLRVSHPRDRHEREAEDQGDLVERGGGVSPLSAPVAGASGVVVQRQTGMEPVPTASSFLVQREPLTGRREPVRRRRPGRAAGPALVQRALGNGGVQRLLAPAGRDLRAELDAGRAGGTPLAARDRARFEMQLGADLATVRLHRGARADALADALGATAFTSGSDVFLGSRAGAPESAAGRRVLAHELVHVLQQTAGQVPAGTDVGGVRVGDLAGASEREAEAVAAGRGRAPAPTHGPRVAVVQRLDTLSAGPATATGSGPIVPDGFPAERHQLRETEFLAEAAARLNHAGDDLLRAMDGAEDDLGQGLGDIYVLNIRLQAAATQKSIEDLVAETVQQSYADAEGYLIALVYEVATAYERSRATLAELQRTIDDTTAQAEGAYSEADIRRFGMGGAALTAESLDDKPRYTGDLLDEYPELTQPLAAALTFIPSSIWGPLSVLLQGTIFHMIISAGYVTGNPTPAHPLALINRGGGVLGRKRTDLRDPGTFSVIEIKPRGYVGGAAQLAAYVATLGPPWHEALDIPWEAWPVTGTTARYPLNQFGINLTLVAQNQFATAAGMLEYWLDMTPGLPVYVPVHAPSTAPKRRYRFTFPQLMPELELAPIPAPSPAVVAGLGVGGMIILLVAATLVPVVPPPP